jgi:hypothetical protein
MHLCVIHHASWHAFHHVKQASFITCSAYEREKIRVDQVSEKVHAPSVGANSDIWIFSWKLTFSAMQASPGA